LQVISTLEKHCKSIITGYFPLVSFGQRKYRQDADFEVESDIEENDFEEENEREQEQSNLNLQFEGGENLEEFESIPFKNHSVTKKKRKKSNSTDFDCIISELDELPDQSTIDFVDLNEINFASLNQHQMNLQDLIIHRVTRQTRNSMYLLKSDGENWYNN